MTYFQKLYSGRIGRKSFILGTLLLMLAYLIVGYLPLGFLVIISKLIPSDIYASFFSYIWAGWLAIVAITISVYSFSLCMRRLHDMGKSHWWLVISVLPIVNLWLVFQKGEEKKNQYGDVPQNNERLSDIIFGEKIINSNLLKSSWVKVLFLLVIIIIIISGFFVLLNNGSNTKCQQICNFNPTNQTWNYPSHTSISDTSIPDESKAIADKYGASVTDENGNKYENGKTFIPTKHFQTQSQCLNYCKTQ
jgi:uncharacterized membrane protein YhaH (DUF805 family)